jgi:hypothetical protein
MNKAPNNIPICPAILPENLENLVKQLSKSWFESNIRPRLSIDVSNRWDAVISEWAKSEDMPLLIRKRKDNAGSELVHSTERIIIPVDNSPAQWVFAMAHNGMDVNLEIIQEILNKDALPMSFAPANMEIEKAKYKCVLRASTELNTRGWKLSHINPVGLKTRKPLIDIPIEKLKNHFIKLMSPSNMFLVPKKWSGLAEFPEMIKLLEGSVPLNKNIKISKLQPELEGGFDMGNLVRDKTKYEFNGHPYPKNRLVLAVLREHLNRHPDCSFEDLKVIFPDDLQGSYYGVFTNIQKAEAIRLKRGKRHFLDKDTILRTGDNTLIAVCNQWGARINIERFVSKAKFIGYDIKEISANSHHIAEV